MKGQPLTDAEVDAFLGAQPPIDHAKLERIRTRLLTLAAEAQDIGPTDKAKLLEALKREWDSLPQKG